MFLLIFIWFKKIWDGVGDYKGEGRSPFLLFNVINNMKSVDFKRFDLST